RRRSGARRVPRGIRGRDQAPAGQVRQPARRRVPRRAGRLSRPGGFVMEERIRDDGFEATFVVSTPRAKAWELLMTAEPAAESLTPPGAGQRWIPAIEGAAEDIEVVPEERLHTRKVTEPCAGTEIVITFEDQATGTRITIVQSGFGPGFDIG